MQKLTFKYTNNYELVKFFILNEKLCQKVLHVYTSTPPRKNMLIHCILLIHFATGCVFRA